MSLMSLIWDWCINSWWAGLVTGFILAYGLHNHGWLP